LGDSPEELMGFLIGLNIILALCGYLLPVPSLAFAWREWSKGRRIPPAKAWRRTISRTALWLLSSGTALWVYAIVPEAWHRNYSYILLSASVGRWGSLGLIIVCAFAESRLRRYLLLGAAGLLFFFDASIGDVTI
jgi:hypothetical protein